MATPRAAATALVRCAAAATALVARAALVAALAPSLRVCSATLSISSSNPIMWAGAVAREARANGINRGFSPEINVCTDPRFGRTEENFGEDPMLVASMGVAAVKGLQGGSTAGASSYLPPHGIISEAKHAAAVSRSATWPCCFLRPVGVGVGVPGVAHRCRGPMPPRTACSLLTTPTGPGAPHTASPPTGGARRLPAFFV